MTQSVQRMIDQPFKTISRPGANNCPEKTINAQTANNPKAHNRNRFIFRLISGGIGDFLRDSGDA